MDKTVGRMKSGDSVEIDYTDLSYTIPSEIQKVHPMYVVRFCLNNSRNLYGLALGATGEHAELERRSIERATLDGAGVDLSSVSIPWW